MGACWLEEEGAGCTGAVVGLVFGSGFGFVCFGGEGESKGELPETQECETGDVPPDYGYGLGD